MTSPIRPSSSSMTYSGGGARDSIVDMSGHIGLAFYDTDPGVTFALGY